MYQIILIGISLALDAMCVTIAMTLGTSRRRAATLVIKGAIIFALFQAIMPIIGFYPAHWITSSIDPAIMNIAAGIILVGVGSHMFIGDLRQVDSSDKQIKFDTYDLPALLLLGVATSIDALAVGISFGCSGNGRIWLDAAIIGVITAIICIASGMIFLHSAKSLLPRNKSGMIGGAILIILGIKMFF